MFEPVAGAQGAGTPLVLAGLGALVLAWLSLRTAPRAFAIVAGLFLLSLAARALLVVYFGAVIAAAFAARARLRRDATVVVLACTGVAIAVAIVHGAAPAAPAPPQDPRAEVEFWRSRDNAWRARGAALAWARAENAAPGEGYVTLAQLDWELGEHEKARRVLGHVIERTHDDELLQRAARLRDAWGDR